MSGTERGDEQKARENREARLVSNRISQLYERPITGQFDLDHLKAVHAHIFQDLPHHRPGVIREYTYGRWTKFRALEGSPGVHAVHYAHEGIEKHLKTTLAEFGGPEALRGQTPDVAAAKLAELYGALDYGHGFHEGNSRTLREFTRELAAAAGFDLDWAGTGVGAPERNALYIARDVAVLGHAFPGLTPERGMQTADREEYEASLALPGLRRAMGNASLEAIIRRGLTETRSLEHAEQAQRAEPGALGRISPSDARDTPDDRHSDTTRASSPPLPPGVMTIEQRTAAASRLLAQIDQRAELGRQASAPTADRELRRETDKPQHDLGNETGAGIER